jgi:hypothetical protein
MSNPRNIALVLAAVLLSGFKQPDISWNCGGTIVNYADEDLGPSTAGVGPDGKPILTTIWVVNPPREGVVFKQYSTPHAYSTLRKSRTNQVAVG